MHPVGFLFLKKFSRVLWCRPASDPPASGPPPPPRTQRRRAARAPRRPGTAHPGRVPSPPAAPRTPVGTAPHCTHAPSGSGSGTAPSGSVAPGDTGDTGDKPPFQLSPAQNPENRGFVPQWVSESPEKAGKTGASGGKPGQPGTQWVRKKDSRGRGDKWPFHAQEALF